MLRINEKICFLLIHFFQSATLMILFLENSDWNCIDPVLLFDLIKFFGHKAFTRKKVCTKLNFKGNLLLKLSGNYIWVLSTIIAFNVMVQSKNELHKMEKRTKANQCTTRVQYSSKFNYHYYHHCSK